MTKAKNRMDTKLYRQCQFCPKYFYSLDYRRKYCSKKCSQEVSKIRFKEYCRKYWIVNKDKIRLQRANKKKKLMD